VSLLFLPDGFSHQMSHAFEEGGMWSPETLVSILYLSVILCTGILMVVFVNSLPNLRMKLKRHVGLAVGAIGVAGVSMAAYGVSAPGYIDIDQSAADAPERIVVAEVAPFGMAERKAKPLPEAEQPTVAVADTGAEGGADSPLYSVHCTACHGPDGLGVEGLGVNLVTSQLVSASSPAELTAFLKEGRLPTDPDSVTGVPMPSFSWMPDKDINAIVTYVQGWAQTE